MYLRTLGGLALEGASIRRPKPLVLLTDLCIEGAQPRRYLTELFWMGAADPRQSLSFALGQLRAGAPSVVSDDGSRPSASVDCDAVALRAAMSTDGRWAEADDVPGHMVTALRQQSSAPDGWTALVAAVGDQRLLLVLDNVEQIDALPTVVTALLDACPTVRLIATSRAPLCIAAELTSDLDVLSGRGPDRPRRPASLRAVFDHAWQRLTPPQRGALERVSVFEGGFTRRAAAAAVDVGVPLLAALVDASLVRRQDRRYEAHPLVRQYARERLGASAATEDATRARHAEYWSAFMAARAGGGRAVLAKVMPEVGNAAAAWRWAAGASRYDLLERMLPALLRGLARATDLLAAATLSRGDAAQGRDLIETALATYRRLEDGQGIVACPNGLALVTEAPDEHRRILEQAIASSLAFGDGIVVSRAIANQGVFMSMTYGAYRIEVELLDQALADEFAVSARGYTLPSLTARRCLALLRAGDGAEDARHRTSSRPSTWSRVCASSRPRTLAGSDAGVAAEPAAALDANGILRLAREVASDLERVP